MSGAGRAKYLQANASYPSTMNAPMPQAVASNWTGTTNWVSTTTSTVPMFTSAQVTKRPSKIKRWAKEAWAWLTDERGGTMGDELKVKREVEHRKKITLKFEEGTARPGKPAAHRGTLEMVRTMERVSGEDRTIGMKVTPESSGSSSGSYVEIPIEDLEKAIAELKAAVPGA